MSSQTIRERGGVEEQDGVVIRHCLERVYSKGELSLVDQLVASDFVGGKRRITRGHISERKGGQSTRDQVASGR